MISKIESEFDEQFNFFDESVPAEIKQFYRGKISEMLEELKMEEKETYATNKDMIYDSENVSYNQAVQELNDKINKLNK